MLNRIKQIVPALLLLVLMVLVGCSTGNSNPQRSPSKIPLADCQLAAPGAAARLAAQCGKLTVPENRADPVGRKIDLNIAVIPSISRAPLPDAFVFITGGPGEASTQDYVALSAAFRQIGQKRDIVLVDQRGTGGSHQLKCPAWENLDGNDETALATWTSECVKQLDADPRFYNTQEAIVDLEDVRAALGYPQFDLYGISYGTRVAQAYLARYPDRVRTVILDGVVSPERPLGLTMASDAQRALDMIFARCAADATCKAAFPDPTGDLAGLLARVDKAPIKLTITHPTTGAPTEIEFTRNTLAAAIRLFSYSAETAALLPLIVHDANKTGDLSRIAAQSLIVSQQVEGSMSIAMHNSVVCAEDVPFYGEVTGATAEAEKRSYMGESYGELQKLCKVWPAAQIPAESRAPVKSNVPVLLLSGEADPVTPPSNAEQVKANLTHSLHLVAPGQGHGNIMRGCISQIATDFVQQGSVNGLDTSCVQSIKPLPFFTSYTGTTP